MHYARPGRIRQAQAALLQICAAQWGVVEVGGGLAGAGGAAVGDGVGPVFAPGFGSDDPALINFCNRSCCCFAKAIAVLPACEYCTALLAELRACGSCCSLSWATESRR